MSDIPKVSHQTTHLLCSRECVRLSSIYTTDRIRERIWTKSVPVPWSGCWLWDGRINKAGYGILQLGNQDLAHRVSYEAFESKIPNGLTLDHLCRVRCCVNPDHLEMTTMRENTLRGESFSAKNARKDYCSNGHPLSGNNLKIGPSGRRCCRACWRARSRAYQIKKRRAV